MSLLTTFARRLPSVTTVSVMKSATWKSSVVALGTTNNRFFSSSVEGGEDGSSTNDDSEEFLTGTVKFYRRAKSYGFIEQDQEGTPDLFIHRGGILCHIPGEKNPYNPFLLKGERVKFQVKPGENDGQFRAHQLTYESGERIPLFRDGYVEKETENATNHLGKQVFGILSDKEGDPTSQIEQIMKAFEATETKIMTAKARVTGQQEEVEAGQE
mmetsp:Transcript_7330/g.10387  ORF Transcript_7330/g.10387 Transcript_7330/m.10387 type:complete len:213 (+) Transcript_7330:97-735(+)